MSESNQCYEVAMEEISVSSVLYCSGCLCESRDKQVHSYLFACRPLNEVFQSQIIYLCYLCKRMAQQAELFIQNVQRNQSVLENLSDVLNERSKSVRLKTQPLVDLQLVSCEGINLCEGAGDSQVSCCVISSRGKNRRVPVKLEMKEEDLLGNLEAEFVNGDDEFPEMFVKEEEDSPLNTMLKEESSTDNIDVKKLSTSVNKKVKKKKSRIKSEDVVETRRVPDKAIIKTVYLTREQCAEEREEMAREARYLDCAFKCASCVKGFTFKGSLDRHLEKHNRCMGEFQCDVCQQRMDSADKLVSHMRYHLIRYVCVACGLRRHCRATIAEHYAAAHAGALHHCAACGKSFKRRLSLRKHAQHAHGPRARVTCAYCDRSYVNKVVLRTHLVRKHPTEVSAGEAKRRCACACGARFRCPSQLQAHALKHSDTRAFYCVECDKSFKSESILKNHLKTAAVHIDYKELPLPCAHCDKRFSNRRDVERHANRVHLNVKPFACDSCDKAYVNSWALRDHKRYAHEGHKRPLQYPCPMCDKLFDRKQTLKSHIRTHTGERPYACGACAARFAQAGVLRTHTRLVHLRLTRDGRPRAAPR